MRGAALAVVALCAAAAWAAPARAAEGAAEQERLGGGAAVRAAGAGPEDDAPTAALPRSPAGRVTDPAGLLRPGERAALEQLLRRKERAAPGGKAPRIALVLVPSLGGEAPEEVALRLAERWRIGGKQDDGVLLLLAAAERRVRIEVGYGLEGQLPDAMAARIIGEIMAPLLRRDERAAALRAAVVALHQAAAGELVTGREAVLGGAGAAEPRDGPGAGRGPPRPGGAALAMGLLLLFVLAAAGGRVLTAGVLLGAILGGGRGPGDGDGDGGDDPLGGGGRFGGGGATGLY